jgi:hypothetical protein
MSIGVGELDSVSVEVWFGGIGVGELGLVSVKVWAGGIGSTAGGCAVSMMSTADRMVCRLLFGSKVSRFSSRSCTTSAAPGMSLYDRFILIDMFMMSWLVKVWVFSFSLEVLPVDLASGLFRPWTGVVGRDVISGPRHMWGGIMLWWCGIFGKGLTVHLKGLSVDCDICVMGLGLGSEWPVLSRSNTRCWYRGSLDIMCSMWLAVRASVLVSFGALVSWFGRLRSAS